MRGKFQYVEMFLALTCATFAFAPISFDGLLGLLVAAMKGAWMLAAVSILLMINEGRKEIKRG